MNSDVLKQFALFAEFGEEERDALTEFLEERKVSKGVPLYREGSEAEGLVLVVAGEVQLKSRRSGAATVLGPGTALGAASLLSVGKREATAVASGPCSFLLFPRTSFHRLAEDAPRIACRLAEAIAAELAALVRESLERVGGG